MLGVLGNGGKCVFLSRPWPVFRVCHRDGIVCMSLITKVIMNMNMNMKPIMKITLGESLLHMKPSAIKFNFGPK